MPDVGTLAGGLDGPGARPDRWSARRSAGPWLGLAGALLCLGAVTMVAASAPGNAAFGRALLELLIVAVPVAAGLYALDHHIDRNPRRLRMEILHGQFEIKVARQIRFSL